jgi:hypothetical protein
MHREYVAERLTKHGKRYTAVYSSWKSMKERCLNPKHPAYHRYGGRGITVDPRWLESFENFLADMGEPPAEGYSIERNDNNVGYNKDNCVWKDRVSQANNRRNNTLIEWDGRTQTLAEWSRETGFSRDAIKKRLDRGWSVAESLTGMRNEHSPSNPG